MNNITCRLDSYYPTKIQQGYGASIDIFKKLRIAAKRREKKKVFQKKFQTQQTKYFIYGPQYSESVFIDTACYLCFQGNQIPQRPDISRTLFSEFR